MGNGPAYTLLPGISYAYLLWSSPMLMYYAYLRYPESRMPARCIVNFAALKPIRWYGKSRMLRLYTCTLLICYYAEIHMLLRWIPYAGTLNSVWGYRFQ